MNQFFPLGNDESYAGLSGKPILDVSPEAVDSTSGTTRSQEATLSRPRCLSAIVVLLLVMGLFVGRALQLQVMRGNSYRVVAEQNRTHTITSIAKRGVIYDHEGIQLLGNAPAFTLIITPSLLPKTSEDRQRVIAKAAELAGILPGDIDLTLAMEGSQAGAVVPIDTPIAYENALQVYVEEERLPGVEVRLLTWRSYRKTPLVSLSHVLGYTGFISQAELLERVGQGFERTDRIGKQGIESVYETELKGTHGKRIVEVDASGKEVSLIREEPSVDGANLFLNVDIDLTDMIEQRLADYMEKHGNHRASVVVMDPFTGGVRALVSVPSYNNNAFAQGISQEAYQILLDDPEHPLFPRATLGEFPPGSTFKPTVAAIALDSGVIDEHTSFLSTGGLRIGQWFFPDWKTGGHGVTDVRKAIAESINTFFYIVGGGFGDFQGLGIEKLTREAQHFGFGQPTGIDLPQEAVGFLPNQQWKEEAKSERWYIGDTYHAAIGQGDVLVTPLQLTNATAIFANGGTLYEPRLVERVEYPDGTIKNIEPVIKQSDVATPETIRIVREGMRQTVTDGSAQFLKTLPEIVAGKTGTAQSGGDKENHAWFTSFGPYEHPELVVTILIEEGGEGSSFAVPIARDIYAWWFANRPSSSP